MADPEADQRERVPTAWILERDVLSQADRSLGYLHGDIKPGSDVLSRAIQDQAGRLVAVRAVTNVGECETMCSDLLPCMGFEYKAGSTGKAECRPLFHLNSMAKCSAGAEFHEKIERVLEPGRDDPLLPVEPLCCQCSSGEVHYSPNGFCVECGADGITERTIPPPGPCRYPAPDPLREDCDGFCGTDVFPEESRPEPRNRPPPPLKHMPPMEDDDIGCFAGICRIFGYEAESQTHPESIPGGETHLSATVSTNLLFTHTYTIAASLVILGAALYWWSQNDKQNNAYQMLLHNDMEL